MAKAVSSEAKVLIVDDEPFSVQAISRILKEANYPVVSTNTGEEAWRLLQAAPTQFSAVILDRMMLGLDGMGLLGQMKQDRRLAHIPVIMMTAFADSEEHVGALKEGVYEFIYKPVQADLLLFALSGALHPSSAHS